MPAPPLRVSLPSPPLRVLLALLPVKELLLAFPAPLIADVPVKVRFSMLGKNVKSKVKKYLNVLKFDHDKE